MNDDNYQQCQSITSERVDEFLMQLWSSAIKQFGRLWIGNVRKSLVITADDGVSIKQRQIAGPLPHMHIHTYTDQCYFSHLCNFSYSFRLVD